MSLTGLYYTLKPFMPRRLQIFLRRKRVEYLRNICQDIWPIDPRAGVAPLNWQEWPDGKRFALVLTHDVEREMGQDRCCMVASLEESSGCVPVSIWFRSAMMFLLH
jgi:hypothetical protein